MRRLSLVVLASGLLVVTVGLSAQKGKTPGPAPVYTWTAFLSSTLPDGSPTNIYGPNQPLTAADGRIEVSYSAPSHGSVGSTVLRINVSTMNAGWLGFRGFRAAANSLFPGTSQVCHFTSTFDVDGFPMWAGPYGAKLPVDLVNNPNDGTSCILDFLSGNVGDALGHRFPTPHWNNVTVDFRAYETDFGAIGIGETVQVPSSALLLSIYEPAGCPATPSDTYYSMVGLSGISASEPFSIRRVNADTWVTDITVPTAVYEYVPRLAVVSRKGSVSCAGSQLTQKTTTEPVRAYITWTRQVL